MVRLSIAEAYRVELLRSLARGLREDADDMDAVADWLEAGSPDRMEVDADARGMRAASDAMAAAERGET